MHQSLSFRTKCALAFFSLAVIVGLVGLIGFFSAKRIQSTLLVFVEQGQPRMRALYELRSTTLELAAGSEKFGVAESGSSQAEGTALATDKYELLAYMEKLDKWILEYDRHRPLEMGSMLEEFTVVKDRMLRSVLLLIEARENRESRPRIKARRLAMAAAKDNLKTIIASAIDMELRAQEEQRAEALSGIRMLIRLGSAITLGAFVLSFAMAAYLSHLVIHPITKLVIAIQEVGRGNFNKRITVTSSDEIGQLTQGFNVMADSLAKSVEERERAQSRALQSEKMVAVGQLAAGVAHEINNPLGIILGFAQSAAKRIPDTDVLSLPIKSIEREALRCRNLVQNLLTFSRQKKSQHEVMDLNEAITSTLDLVAAQARLKSVDIITELSALPAFAGDKNQLQQIIINLCGNAIDAMPLGGKIIIRTKQLGVGDNKQALLEISDTGSGVSREIQDKIFNPFFTTKEVGQGTGLGLSLVYEIVQSHRGKIEVRSEEGQGTTFAILFPLGLEASKAQNL